jgi:hypothetical protein
LVEGMTLRTLLDRGRVDVRQSLDIASKSPRPSSPPMPPASCTAT